MTTPLIGTHIKHECICNLLQNDRHVLSYLKCIRKTWYCRNLSVKAKAQPHKMKIRNLGPVRFEITFLFSLLKTNRHIVFTFLLFSKTCTGNWKTQTKKNCLHYFLYKSLKAECKQSGGFVIKSKNKKCFHKPMPLNSQPQLQVHIVLDMQPSVKT